MFTCVRSRMSKNMVYVHVYVYVRVVGSRESRVGSATASAFPSGLLMSVLEVGLRYLSSMCLRICFWSCVVYFFRTVFYMSLIKTGLSDKFIFFS